MQRETNELIYGECHWITDVANDCYFIMTHYMRLAMFNNHCNLKMLSVAETCFASTIVMLKKFKQIKHGLQNMVIGERWSSYKEEDIGKAAFLKVKVLNDSW